MARRRAFRNGDGGIAILVVVMTRTGLLAALLPLATVLATRAFRAYQNSI